MKQILDIGCGEGIFEFRLMERLCGRGTGCLVVPSIAEVVHQRLNRVLCGNIMQQLEHTRDYWKRIMPARNRTPKIGVTVCQLSPEPLQP